MSNINLNELKEKIAHGLVKSNDFVRLNHEDLIDKTIELSFRECFLFVKEKLEARKNYARKEWENAYSKDYEKNKCKVLAMRHLENEMTSLLSELVLLEEEEKKEKEEVKK